MAGKVIFHAVRKFRRLSDLRVAICSDSSPSSGRRGPSLEGLMELLFLIENPGLLFAVSIRLSILDLCGQND